MQLPSAHIFKFICIRLFIFIVAVTTTVNSLNATNNLANLQSKTICNQSFEAEQEFASNVETLVEENIGISNEIPIVNAVDELDSIISGFKANLKVLAGRAALVIGAGMSIYGIVDGIVHHKTDEITINAISLGSIIGTPILVTAISEAISEAVAEVVGNVVGFVITEGIAVYQLIKDNKEISKIIDSDQDLENAYNANVERILHELLPLKRVIEGDPVALSDFLDAESLNTEYAANALFEINKAQIEKITKKLYRVAFEKKAKKQFQEVINPENSGYYIIFETGTELSTYDDFPELQEAYWQSLILNNIDVMSDYLTEKYTEKTRTLCGLTGELNGCDQYEISDAYYFTGSEGQTFNLLGISSSHYYMYYYEEIVDWLHYTIKPVIKYTLYEAFNDTDALAEEFFTVMKHQFENPREIQEQLVRSYNDSVIKKISWLIFGQQLLINITHNSELATRAMLIRLAGPILMQLIDTFTLHYLETTINVAPAVNMLVTHMLKADLSVFDDAAVEDFLHNRLDDSWGNLDEIKDLWNQSLQETQEIIRSRYYIQEDSIQEFPEIDPALIQKLDTLIQSETYSISYSFKNKLSNYVNDIFSLVYPALGEIIEPDVNKTGVSLAFASSHMHHSYNERILSRLATAKENVQAAQNNYEIVFALEDAIQDINFTYMSHMNSNESLGQHSYKQGHTTIPWITFRSLPGVTHETMKILSYFSDTITAVKAFIAHLESVMP